MYADKTVIKKEEEVTNANEQPKKMRTICAWWREWCGHQWWNNGGREQIGVG